MPRSSGFSASWWCLRDEYQRLVAHPPVDIETVWRLFVEDPWYQHELHRAASWVARRARLPRCEADDLCHEAMLILHSRLTRRPDLRLNRALAVDHFGAWLRRVVRRHCLDALRRGCVGQGHCESLPKDDVLAERKIESWLSDLHEEIGRLPSRERVVVCAYGACGSLAEAAASLGLDYHRARRALRSGIARLRAGAVGDDADGRVVRRLLEEMGIDASLIQCDAARPTTCKQRLVGRAAGRHPHQIVRVDHEDARPLPDDLASRLSAAVAGRLANCQALLISDYGKGVCSPGVLSPIIRAARRAGVPVIVDPARDADYARYRHASLIKPNRAEAQLASGLTINSPSEAFAAARKICGQTRAEAALVTLESEGMALVTSAGEEHLLPARSRAVYDVTGAGDMALAALGLARAGGADWRAAAELAVAAAGLEVERFGVTPISREELAQGIQGIGYREQGIVGVADSSVPCSPPPVPYTHQKVVAFDRLEELIKEHRAVGRTIVLANGVFDLLHVGHVRCLQEAAAQGDVLIVAVNGDASARRLKGAGRPVFNARSRGLMIAALGCVEHVVVLAQRTPRRLIELVKPDVLVKGGDYSPREVIGREIVESYGGRVHRAGHVRGVSTTRMIEAIAGRAEPRAP